MRLALLESPLLLRARGSSGGELDPVAGWNGRGRDLGPGRGDARPPRVEGVPCSRASLGRANARCIGNR
jgi:hypothetical protein